MRRGHAFPARAGINRTPPRPSTCSTRVPRPRGDQPAIPDDVERLTARSPPARGSTDAAVDRPPLGEAFPARAGINRFSRPTSSLESSVPRPRGDQPAWQLPRQRGTTRSPPARGSTAFRRLLRATARAFPARAGINRRYGRGGPHIRRVPRPRGDQPGIVWTMPG